MLPLVLIVLLLAAPQIFAAPQCQITIPVAVTAAPDSPVTLTGQVAYIDKGAGVTRYASDGKVLAKNISDKPILLLIVKGEFDDGKAIRTADTNQNDYFFVSDVLAPNAIETLDLSTPAMSRGSAEQRHPPPPSPRRANAHVAFVEFADGSYWGDLQAAKELLQDRIAAWRRLSELQQIYRLNGEQAFLTELMRDSRLLAVEMLQDTYKKDKNVTGAVAQLNDMLVAADAHRAAATPHR